MLLAPVTGQFCSISTIVVSMHMSCLLLRWPCCKQSQFLANAATAAAAAAAGLLLLLRCWCCEILNQTSSHHGFGSM